MENAIAWLRATTRFLRRAGKLAPALSGWKDRVFTVLLSLGVLSTTAAAAAKGLLWPVGVVGLLVVGLLACMWAGIRREHDDVLAERVDVHCTATPADKTDADTLLFSLLVHNDGPSGRFSARILGPLTGAGSALVLGDDDSLAGAWQASLGEQRPISHSTAFALWLLEVDPKRKRARFWRANFDPAADFQTAQYFAVLGELSFRLEIRDVHRDVARTFSVHIENADSNAPSVTVA